VFPLLRRQAGALAERWTARARGAVFLGPEGQAQDGFPTGEAAGLLDTLLGGSSGGDDGSEPTIDHAIRFGRAAFEHGVSVHQMMKALDLLVAMTLFAMESALAQPGDGPVTTASDGVRLARRLHGRNALLTLAATRGYMHAYAEALRDRFRHLRHDLRTPLGTIKSVLALMDDESVPLEARADPSFRAMATRNAKSLDELIGMRLADATVLLPATGQDVSVHAIVCAVRRELRAECERHGVVISVDEEGPHGRMDATGLELLLREVLESALQECEAGERLHIVLDRSPGHAIVAIRREENRSVLRRPHVLDRLSGLAGQIGAKITAGDRLSIAIPLRPSDVPTADRARVAPQNAEELREGEARHDVRSARESHHGQAGAH
jgi:signal transduction histidine kinase